MTIYRPTVAQEMGGDHSINKAEQKLFVRNGKDNTSRIGPKEVAAFVERFEENGSMLAKDYQDVTFKASYLLAAMKYITLKNALNPGNK